MAMRDWTADASCGGRDHPGMFFNEEPAGKRRARELCEACPVRSACVEAALVEERGLGADYRHGIRGYTTGAQRHSIELRGGLNGADPVKYVKGYDTARERAVAPMGDMGDLWTPSHDRLAAALVAWLHGACVVGLTEVSPRSIAGKLKASLKAATRVTSALVDDGALSHPHETLTADTVLVYSRPPEVPWTPPHLR